MSEIFILRLAGTFKEQDQQQLPSKFGGHPIFFDGLSITPYCQSCQKQMTYIGQIFCPQKTQYTYNRALFVYVCLMCQFQVRAFRMQTNNRESKYEPFKSKCLQKEHGIEVEQIDKYPQYTLQQIDSQQQQNEQSAIQQAISQDQEQQNKRQRKSKISRQNQQYLFKLKSLDNPVGIYGANPLTIKRKLTNPPRCLNCGGPAKHQLQINSCLLDYFKQLILKDWGVISIYTCQKSCGQKGVKQQYIIVEDQEGQIKKQTKTKKKHKKSKRNKSDDKPIQKDEQCNWD